MSSVGEASGLDKPTQQRHFVSEAGNLDGHCRDVLDVLGRVLDPLGDLLETGADGGVARAADAHETPRLGHSVPQLRADVLARRRCVKVLPVNDAHYELRPVGWVESPLVDLVDAPPQGDEGVPNAWIALRPELRTAMRDLEVGAKVLVLTWLDRADRGVLEVHPRDDPRRPLHGVFSTRSPDRPNPIGLHQVEILAIDNTRLLVRNLEAIHGTPVVDIKPVLGAIAER